MAQQVINAGTVTADGTGEALHTAFVKTNANFTELYARSAYTLPAATTVALGGIKAGTGLAVALDGTLSVSYAYTLPTASTTVLGGVKVDGTTVTINGSGVISASTSYTLPAATTSVLGGVKVDGTTITIAGGVISAATGGGGTITGVTAGTGLTGGGTTGTVTLTVSYGTSGTTAAVGNDSRIVGAEQTVNKGATNGYAPLDGSSLVPLTNLPIVSVAKGGTGTTTPGIVAGTNVTVSGSWPNQTVNSSSGSSNIVFGTTITGAGAIPISEGYSVINNASAASYTLANDTVDGHQHAINNYGAGTSTITVSKLQGTASVALTVPSGGVVNLVWHATLATYLYAS